MENDIDRQMAEGISKICSVKNQNCNNCPFYIGECPFEIKPVSWLEPTKPLIEENKEDLREYVEDLLGEKLPDYEPIEKSEVTQTEEPESEIISQETVGTWEIRTTMSKGLFSKYIFICSKCGYQKESYFSSPMGTCPNCDKTDFSNIINKIE